MSEILDRVSNARERVSPAWTVARERSLRWRVERGLERRRRIVRVVGGAVLVVTAFILGHAGIGRLFGSGGAETRTVASQSRLPSLLELTDGTRVTAVSGNARVEPLEVSPHRVTVRLEAGSARFDVARREDRQFRVQARDVTVTVLGTAFTVEVSPVGVRVRVERGRVEVAWPGAHRQLIQGQEVLAEARPAIGPLPSSTGPPLVPEAAPNGVASAPRLNGGTPPSPPSLWRGLAQEGDYRGAFARMVEEGASAVRDEPGDLLFAADVARLSGHSELAVPRLERVIKAHPSDSRAPLAAFTLGRTLLDGLGRPREAAEAFARVRRLSPGGALSQDALAREVESWSRAGEPGLARKRALDYLHAFPGGRREKAVRYHGGLE